MRGGLCISRQQRGRLRMSDERGFDCAGKCNGGAGGRGCAIRRMKVEFGKVGRRY